MKLTAEQRSGLEKYAKLLREHFELSSFLTTLEDRFQEIIDTIYVGDCELLDSDDIEYFKDYTMLLNDMVLDELGKRGVSPRKQ